MRKKFFVVLLMAVFVLAIGISAADAAWTSSFTSAKKILLNSSATLLASQSAGNAIAYTLGTGESLNTNDTIAVTLSGGAKFSSTSPGLSTTGATVFASLVGNPTGAATANFRVTASALIPSDVIQLNVQSPIFDVSAVTGPVDITFNAVTSTGGLTIFNSAQSSKTSATYAFTAPSAMESVNILSQSNVADVSATTGAFTKFTGASVTGTATTYSYTNLSDETATGTVPSGQMVSAGKVVFNIAGSLTGITTISGTGCTGSNAAGLTTGGTANFFLFDSTKANAYCVNTAAVQPAAAGVLSLAPVFTIDGTTAQVARGFTASVAALADGTKWAAHTALSPTTLYSITRNGSSFVTNSVGTRNTIKITDRSGGVATAGGAITITAWDANGVSLPLSSGAVAYKILNNATTSLTGAQLIAQFTGTAMKYEFAVESSSIVVSNVKVSTDGVNSSTTIFTSAPATATGYGQGI
ncbi:MAG: hypothetical protein ABSE05_15665 [Syntrophales bacterium]|jgi:hypothetical protein